MLLTETLSRIQVLSVPTESYQQESILRIEWNRMNKIKMAIVSENDLRDRKVQIERKWSIDWF